MKPARSRALRELARRASRQVREVEFRELYYSGHGGFNRVWAHEPETRAFAERVRTGSARSGSATAAVL
eukprot:2882737-Prymnesium_polylepis.1